MAKQYFQMIPTVDYDIDGDGTTKVVVDILRRIRARTDFITHGAIFYNYTMQDGDNAEIIADKYYGSSQYHWIVMIMNNIIDHTYDLALNSFNFENYINAEYGSHVRALGTSINLASTDYMSTSITPNWHSVEQSSGPFGVTGANTGIELGSWPAGHSTAITIYDKSTSDPFMNVDVGDVVHLFVPNRWYEGEDTTTHSGTLAQASTKEEKVIYLQADSASVIENIYNGGVITITGEGTGTTGITGNTRTMNVYTSVAKSATLGLPFLDAPTAEWTYDVVYPTPPNLSKIGYTAPAKVISKSKYRTGLVQESGGAWIPSTQNETRYFQINTDLNSNTFNKFSWDPSELVHLQTGIHHFEMDVYNSAGTLKLANNVAISQKQYANMSIGTASTKSIVSNYDYEIAANDDKRNIYLLKKDYLQGFIAEFETLMKVGA